MGWVELIAALFKLLPDLIKAISDAIARHRDKPKLADVAESDEKQALSILGDALAQVAGAK